MKTVTITLNIDPEELRNIRNTLTALQGKDVLNDSQADAIEGLLTLTDTIKDAIDVVDDTPVSACAPDVNNSTKIGMLFNTRFEKGKLKSDAWIYRDTTVAKFPEIWKALLSNTMQEVSTGMFFDLMEDEGVWNGEEYMGIASSIRPDHLAILPDEIGACSIVDGAGIPRLNKETEKMDNEKVMTNQKIRINLDPSYNALYDAVNVALQEEYKYDYWIEDLYPDSVVFGVYEKKKLYRAKVTISDPLKITIGDKVEVTKVVTYTPSDITANAETVKEDKMEKEIVKNEEAKVETPASVIKNEAKPVIHTIDSYVDAAPDEFKGELAEALSVFRAEKVALVDSLLANKNCQFTQPELAALSSGQLKKIAALITPVENEEVKEEKVETPAANFTARPALSTSNSVKVEALVAPSLWDTK